MLQMVMFYSPFAVFFSRESGTQFSVMWIDISAFKTITPFNSFEDEEIIRIMNKYQNEIVITIQKYLWITIWYCSSTKTFFSKIFFSWGYWNPSLHIQQTNMGLWRQCTTNSTVFKIDNWTPQSKQHQNKSAFDRLLL